jgi:hypothetical protein
VRVGSHGLLRRGEWVAAVDGPAIAGRSFPRSFHLPLLDPTGAYWLDDPSDLTCKDSTQQYPVDDPLLSCKQQVGGSTPPRQLPKVQVTGCLGLIWR